MKTTQFFSTLLLLLFTVNGLHLKSQNPDNVKLTAKTLSAPEYNGRSLIREGDKKAAKWISGKYSEYGLKQWNKDYFQPFSVSGNTFPGKLEVAIDGKKLVPGEDYYLRLSCPDTIATYEIVKFYDSDFSRENAEKLLTKDLKHTVLILDMDFLMTYNKPDSIIRKVFTREIGAYIFLTEHTFRWYNIYGNEIIHQPMIDMKKSAFDTQSSTLTITVDAEYIHNYPTQNVIGYIPGSKKPDEYIVICGHYDHLGMMGEKVLFPGADDNASAIGIILELANYYSQPAHKPDRTLIFAAFSSEETGLQGSDWFVKNCPVDSSKIVLSINFDMVAFGKDSFMVYNGIENPQIMNALNQTCTQLNLPFVYSARENIPLSDHFSFTDKGIPAIFITSDVEMSPDYHTHRDDYQSARFYNIRELMLSMIAFINGI